MHQIHLPHIQRLLRKIATMKFDTGQCAVSRPDHIQVARVDINSNNPSGHGAIDMLQAVSSRHTQHGDALWAGVEQRRSKEIRQGSQLLYPLGIHMAFIFVEWYGEPRIWHEPIVATAPPHAIEPDRPG